MKKSSRFCTLARVLITVLAIGVGFGRCCDNEPTMNVGEPVCGNCIREADEVCDCGSPQECTDPCCNARTCQLASGAECSAGLCCQSNCQFRPYGTTCRAASGQCDIAEYCSRDSTECPADVNLQDGTACSSNGNQGYCFDGACPTHDDQCLFHFGSASGMAVQECYSNYNTRGDQFGNCGHTATQFLQCSAGNVLCGQLQCITGTYQNTADVSVTIGSGSVFISSTRSLAPCQSFTTQPGADIMSPGLVLDGTRCGNERLCFEQQCVPLSQLSVQPCGTGSNGLVCSGNGQCNNLGHCSCNVGQTGSVCQTPTSGPGSGPVNECLNNNGACAQICVDTTASFTCSCNAGFTLASNGLSCNDIIECNTNNGGCSHTCINTVGSFRCSCPTGFRLSGDGRNCIEINECSEGTSGCDQFCSNTEGSFQCGCDNGFRLSGNGRTCNDINECNTNNGGCSQTCINTVGSFRCSCSTGFRLSGDGRTCTDINECNSNNGGCSHTCINTVGSFRCSCSTGFRLSGDGRTCTDINECTEGTSGCEQSCSNTQGSFQCGCNNGFRLNRDDRTCDDINECNEGTSGCAEFCTNSQGSFQCSCRSGFRLGSNSRSCVDIDECSTDNGGCDHTCSNSAGSFSCSCRSGFTLDSDGKTCNANGIAQNCLPVGLEQLKESLKEIVRDELASLKAEILEKDKIIQESLCMNRTGEIRMCAGKSCKEIFEEKQDRPSGYYWLKGCDTCELFQVFCDFSLNFEGGKGWMRVADLDMTDHGQQCPSQFRLITSPRRMCGKHTNGFGCDSTHFETHRIRYNKVAGRAVGYAVKSLDGFNTSTRCPGCNIDKPYVDGVSVTHGYPRRHIWTFAGTDNIGLCPCAIGATQYQPSYVGNDYYCEVRSTTSDLLWDGEGCNGREFPCCHRERRNSGWFIKELNAPTTDDIEVRLCTDESLNDEDIWVERFELYAQ